VVVFGSFEWFNYPPLALIARMTLKIPQQNGICATSKQSLEKLQEVLCGHSPAIVSIAEQPREGLQVAYCANGQFYASNYAVGTWFNMGL